jgi:hypothetical protein
MRTWRVGIRAARSNGAYVRQLRAGLPSDQPGAFELPDLSLLATGQLPPDRDFAPHWITLFNDSMMVKSEPPARITGAA